MAQDTRQFPHGFEVNIVRKEDIMRTIDENIIDKNVAYELISTLSYDIAKNINAGKWTGIPYIGNVKPNLLHVINNKNKDIIQDAKETLSKEDYIIFKKQLNKQTAEQARIERVSKYQASMFASKHSWLYRRFLKKGDLYATAKCYFLSCMKPVMQYYQYSYGAIE